MSDDMPSRLDKQKACLACAEAKRRCDKSLPECQRCLDRDIDCQYPQPKRRRKRPYNPALDGMGSAAYPEAYLDLGDINGVEHQGTEQGAPIDSALSTKGIPDSMVAISMPGISFAGHENVFDLPSLHGNFVSTASNDTVSNTATASFNSPFTITTTSTNSTTSSSTINHLPWFLHPTSWVIHYTNHDPGCVSDIRLEPSVKKVEQMLQDWLQHGHNAFIPRQLYANNGLPECLQDAYITLSAYTHKTKEVKEMVTQIAEGKMAALAALGSTRLPATTTSTVGTTEGEMLEKLARVQALFIHIFIHLFDGSVRQRAKAEKYLPTLRSWVSDMYDAAKRYHGPIPTSEDGQPEVMYPTGTQHRQQQEPRVIWHLDPATMSAEQEHDTLTSLWKAWILTESVRRTYTVVETVMNVYEIMTKGQAECQGGVSFTGRKGAWDADTAVSWRRVVGDGLGVGFVKGYGYVGQEESLCGGLEDGENREKVPLLVEALQPESIMVRCSSRDVDDFAILCWSFIVGEEKVKSWIDRSEGARG